MTTATRTRKTEQLDLTEQRREFFCAGRTPQLVYLAEASYLAMEGAGRPEETLSAAIGAMYTAAYGLKFRLKREGDDFKVCPVQAQWWSLEAGGLESPNIGGANPQDWHWRFC